MKTKKKMIEPEPDVHGFYTRANALKKLDFMGVSYCKQAIEEAYRENVKDSCKGIPHLRMNPEKDKSQIRVRIEDILEWLQRGNSTSIDLRKVA